MSSNLAFIHRFEPATRLEAPPLLLLHGTGGDENDLLQLGRLISPGSALLSPRGKVLENGMPRFFRRHAEGVFDEDDVRQRAHELADFVEAARKAYGIGRPVAVGYSNGANIAAATMLLAAGCPFGRSAAARDGAAVAAAASRSIGQACRSWFPASMTRSSRLRIRRGCATCCRRAVRPSKRTRYRWAISCHRRT